MANPEHLEILKKGVAHWNQWRKENPEIRPDLSKLNLRGANLRKADLSRANLYKANLNYANLINVNLSEASLSEASLQGTSFNSADLHGANLTKADIVQTALTNVDLSDAQLQRAELFEVDLSCANLNRANFTATNLRDTNLSGANFSGTILSDTLFSNINLSEVNGLAHCDHIGPSIIDHRTLIRSGKLPEAFLRGCGFPDQFIDNLPSLLGSIEPIQFYSSFISYSTKDDEFAHCLHADLQAKGIRCWFAPEDLKIGEKFRTRIDEVIRIHDKLLLILSESSVNSEWVEKEVETAFEKERERKETVLFPIRLDDAVMDVKNGWPADIRRTRHIGDFADWKNHDSYQKAFKRLLRDLGKENNDPVKSDS